jgi:MoxR-like ATPase
VVADYIPTNSAERAKAMLERGRSVYVTGPAGSGKSMAVRWACKELQRRMIFISMHSHIMADVLEGYSWLTVEDGKTCQVWSPGIIEKALTEGAVLVVDEFDRAPIAVQHLLNDVVQSGSFTLKEGPNAGTTIHGKPGFLLVATGNTINGSSGEYASQSIDKSTLSRFRVLHIDYDRQAERELLLKRGLDTKTAEKIIALADIARDRYARHELSAAIGTRHILHIAEDILDGDTLAEAWEANVSLQQASPGEPEYEVCQSLLAIA